jgi:hypothetical protein
MATNSGEQYPFQSVIDPTGVQQTGPLGSAAHLGMYTTSNAPDQSGWGAQGGGAVWRFNGGTLSDTAGAVTPGTTGPSIRDTIGSGGLFGTFDASRYFGLTGDQSLVLNGVFDYRSDSMSLGAAPALGIIGNAGSIQSSLYTFAGNALYRSGTAYVIGSAGYRFGHANETDNVTPATGGFGVHGYFVDARFGKVFELLNTSTAIPAALPTKAPPKATGGIGLALDLSGHIGYAQMTSDGFTDSSGFIFGTGQVQQGDVGGRARLIAFVPGNGWVWMPYVSGTVDQLFAVSDTLTVPSQPAIPGGDVLSLQVAKTFLGSELGLDVRSPYGPIVGVKGFYEASADTNVAGGAAFVKIPLNYTPKAAWTTKY